MSMVKTLMLAVFALALALPVSSAEAQPAWWGEWDDMDRPDLMDVREPGNVFWNSNSPLAWDAFIDDDQTSSRMSMASAEWGTAVGYLTGSTGNLSMESGSFSAGNATSSNGGVFPLVVHPYYVFPASAWSGAAVDWWIFEPDRIKRGYRKTKLRQRAYLGFEVFLAWHVAEGDDQSNISSVSYYGTIETCAARALAKDGSSPKQGSQADDANCANLAKWTVHCDKKIAEVLATLRSTDHEHGEQGDLITSEALARVLDLVGKDFDTKELAGKDRDHVCDPLDDEKGWMQGEGEIPLRNFRDRVPPL